MPKGFSLRGPKLRLSSKGLKITKPSARIGGKAGINLSSSGVSGSLRTKAGSINTKKGCSIPFLGGLLLLLMLYARKH